MKRIYLDHNASTPLDPLVYSVMVEQLKEEIANPSSIHLDGQKAKQKLEKSRAFIASFFEVRPDEVIFTSGGTEAAALLLNGILEKSKNGHVISSKLEHPCVSHTLQAWQKKGISLTLCQTGMHGAVDPSDVRKAIRSDTSLITLMAANNETGVLTNLQEIASIAEKFQIPFIVDGVAWLGKDHFQLLHPGISAIFFSGHKIYAPKGIGFCICRRSLKLSPCLLGGSQEFAKRAGTENLTGIIAVAEAVRLLQQDQSSIKRIAVLRNHFEQELKSRLTNVVINGTGPRLCNTANLSFLGVDGESLLINLDLAGISASHGSACSSGALEPSSVLLNMGMAYQQARSAIRFSLGRFTTEEEIGRAIEMIVKVVNRLNP
jgi:cysteine desulfurase